MSNDQNYFPEGNNFANNWFLTNQDSEFIANEHFDYMQDFFDLVNNDTLLNDVDLKEFFSQDEEIKPDNSFFCQIESQNDQIYCPNNNFVPSKQDNLVYAINDSHNYSKPDATINDFNNDLINSHDQQLSLPPNVGKTTDDKQKFLIEQLLQRFQQDSSSAELILQLLELAKSTGNKSLNQEMKLPIDEKQMIEIKPQVNTFQPPPNTESNSYPKDVKSKLIKIERKQVPKNVQLISKPAGVQSKSQIVLKQISPNQSLQQLQTPTQKIMVQQVSSVPLQTSQPQQQQYFITTTNNCIVGTPTTASTETAQITSKHLTVEDLQKMLQIKTGQKGEENHVQQPAVINSVVPSSNTIITTVPFKVVDRNDKVAITRLPAPQLYRGERKSTHNAIEKKYRMSINSRLGELKELIDGKDSRLNKSSILKKAIENIRYLRAANHRLNEEVKYLKSLIGQKHIDVEVLTPPMETTDFLVEYNLTPEGSHMDAQSYSSDDGFPSSPENTIDDTVFLGSGMDANLVTSYLSKSQYLLSFFFVIMFVVNPIGLLMGSTSFAVPGLGRKIDDDVVGLYGHRTLLSAQDEAPRINTTSSVWIRWITLWTTNIILTLLIFARVTMFSEPVFKSDSKVGASFWRAIAQADVSIERGDFNEGERQLSLCLELLGRPQPKRFFPIFLTLLWNILRQFLHRMHIGGWLESKAGDHVWWRSDSVSEVKQSASMATLVYVKLLRMYIIRKTPHGSMYAMNLALSTINMAEASGEALPQTTLAESYVLLALTMRTVLPTFLHSYIQFTLHQTISELKLSPELSWLHTTEGLNFIFSQPFESRDFKSYYTSQPQKQGDALACMTRLYKEYLQEQTLASMIMTFGLPFEQYKQAMIDLKEYTSLLQKCTQDLHSERKGGADVKVQWWCSVLLNAILLPDQYERLTCKRIDHPPADLLQFPLAGCVHRISKARDMLGEDAVDSEAVKVVCAEACALLKQSFSFKDDSFVRKCITENWQLLSCDWLLTYLTDVIQKDECGGGYVNGEYVTNTRMICSDGDLLIFEDLLSILRRLALRIKVAQPKLVLHETALRLIAGANPIKTRQLFERNVRQRNFTKETNEECAGMSREEASSVLLWLRSLPKQMADTHQSSALLHAAVSAFEGLGDTRSATMCRSVMLRTNI